MRLRRYLVPLAVLATAALTAVAACSQDFSDHLSIIYDHNALHLVLNALDPSTATPTYCAPVLPVLGG